MDILVVSGCSGDKMFDDDELPLNCTDIDSTSRTELTQEYPDYVATASEMYTGEEHGYVQRAVANLREHAHVSWQIISAGYGLVDEDDEIVAYDCTLNDTESVLERATRTGHDPEALTHDKARRVVGRDTKMVSDLREALANDYDLAFTALSKPYYAAISEALRDTPSGITVVAFASKGSKQYLGDAYWSPATNEVRAALGSNNFRLRGELLENASENVDKTDLAKIIKEPETIEKRLPALQKGVWK